MSKVLVTSDQHIHPHSGSLEKLNNCLEAFQWVYRVAEEKGITSVVSLGDLFHDRQRINTLAYHKVYDVIANANASGITTYLLLGNHDRYLRESFEVNSIKPMEQIARVILGPERLNIEGLDFDFLPYVSHPSEEINRAFPTGSRSNVLCSHIAIQGGVMNKLWGTKYDEELDRGSDTDGSVPQRAVGREMFKEYELVLLGHFHSRQTLTDPTKIIYVGSPLQINFGDANDSRGVSILDTESLEVTFVENTFSPRYFILPYDTDLQDHDVKGGYLRLIAPRDVSPSILMEIRQRVEDELGPQSLEVMTSGIEDRSEVAAALDHSIEFTEDKKKMLEVYINSVGVPEGLNRERLLQIGIGLTQIN